MRKHLFLGLVYLGSCHVLRFIHKQLEQRNACSAFLAPESLHDRKYTVPARHILVTWSTPKLGDNLDEESSCLLDFA